MGGGGGGGGGNMGPTWVLSAPDGPHVGPMNLGIRDIMGVKAWTMLPGYNNAFQNI